MVYLILKFDSFESESPIKKIILITLFCQL